MGRGRAAYPLASEIADGDLEVDDQLPTEDSLISRFGSAELAFVGLFRIL
jgi:DNA-binding GntR family transcriptional regulator